MKWNNVVDFMDALEDRIEQLEENQKVTSSTDIYASNFTEGELFAIDSIKDEAFALTSNRDDAVEMLCNRLIELGYTDDQITQILDYEGL